MYLRLGVLAIKVAISVDETYLVRWAVALQVPNQLALRSHLALQRVDTRARVVAELSTRRARVLGIDSSNGHGGQKGGLQSGGEHDVGCRVLRGRWDSGRTSED